jgi:hypothetical protein
VIRIFVAFAISVGGGSLEQDWWAAKPVPPPHDGWIDEPVDPIAEQMRREREADPERWRREMLAHRREVERRETRQALTQVLVVVALAAALAVIWFGRNLPSRVFRTGWSRLAALCWFPWAWWAEVYIADEVHRNAWLARAVLLVAAPAFLVLGIAWVRKGFRGSPR